MEKNYKLYHGDCLDKLKELEDNSIDSIVTDPPYGLAFMGKKWDYDVPSQQIWEECLRVLKPGGHLLAFAGSRTYHRMAVRIEDAGFEIRDQIMWVYGSGFPKSHNVGKAVDKLQGNDREVVGERKVLDMTGGNYKNTFTETDKQFDITKGNSPYEGWGTALKPAHEPIVMARKPFKGSVAENVLEWGTGGINVDGCRVGNEVRKNQQKNFANNVGGVFKETNSSKDEFVEVDGRFPANFILECTCDNPIVKENTNQPYTYKDKNYSEQGFLPNVNGVAPYNYNDTNSGVVHTDPNCPCYILDEQSGTIKGGKNMPPFQKPIENNVRMNSSNEINRIGYGDTGGASRFFYCPKANKSDRDEGITTDAQALRATKGGSRDFNARCANCGKKFIGSTETICNCDNPITDNQVFVRKNFHPTVKPTELMTYLIRLVTPKDGIVLDPFMGSGSTGKAAIREGFGFVGIEREEEYLQIAEQRIEWEYNKQHPHNWF